MSNNFPFTLKFPLWLRLEVSGDHSWLHCLCVAAEPQDGLTTIWCMNLAIVILVSSSHIHAQSAFTEKSTPRHMPMQCLTNALCIQCLKMLNFHGRTLKAAFLLFVFSSKASPSNAFLLFNHSGMARNCRKHLPWQPMMSHSTCH